MLVLAVPKCRGWFALVRRTISAPLFAPSDCEYRTPGISGLCTRLPAVPFRCVYTLPSPWYALARIASCCLSVSLLPSPHPSCTLCRAMLLTACGRSRPPMPCYPFQVSAYRHYSPGWKRPRSLCCGAIFSSLAAAQPGYLDCRGHCAAGFYGDRVESRDTVDLPPANRTMRSLHSSGRPQIRS